MSSSYIAAVGDVIRDNPNPEAPVPGGVLEQAIILQRSPVLPALAGTIAEFVDLDGLSEPDINVFTGRVLASVAVQTAVGSWYAAQESSHVPVFSDLSASGQEGVLHEAAIVFAWNLSKELEASGRGVSDVLDVSEFAATTLRAASPVPFANSLIRGKLHEYKEGQITRQERLRWLGRYLDIRIESFNGDNPPTRRVGANDSVLVQAFGRNMFKDSELPEVRRRYDEAGGDDMLMWNILASDDFDAGASNQALAEHTRTLLQDQHHTGILQWEVAYALFKQDPAYYDEHKNRIFTVWPTSGFYPTYEVKRDSIATMDRIGLYNPIELAHKGMIVRALGILAKQGIRADPDIAEVPFDTDGVQAQTRDPSHWMGREILARLEHVMRGRVKF